MFYIEDSFDVAELVRLGARHKGLTLAQLADKAGVHRDYASRYPRNQSMRLHHVIVLLEAAGFRLVAVHDDGRPRLPGQEPEPEENVYTQLTLF